MDVCPIDLVFLRSRGLKDECALNKQENRSRVEERVEGEEYDIGLQHRCPYKCGQDPDTSLCEDS